MDLMIDKILILNIIPLLLRRVNTAMVSHWHLLVVSLLRIKKLRFHTKIVSVCSFGGDHEVGVLVTRVRAHEEILVLIWLELLALRESMRRWNL